MVDSSKTFDKRGLLAYKITKLLLLMLIANYERNTTMLSRAMSDTSIKRHFWITINCGRYADMPILIISSTWNQREITCLFTEWQKSRDHKSRELFIKYWNTKHKNNYIVKKSIKIYCQENLLKLEQFKNWSKN